MEILELKSFWFSFSVGTYFWGVWTHTLGIWTYTVGIWTYTLGIWTYTLGIWTYTLGVWTYTLDVRAGGGGRKGGGRAAPATAATSQELSHLVRPLDHHVQGPNIPFGESLTSTYMSGDSKMTSTQMPPLTRAGRRSLWECVHADFTS